MAELGTRPPGAPALLLADPAAVANPFYLPAPQWALHPMVVLATWATVIASHAVISAPSRSARTQCSSNICHGLTCATRRRRRWVRCTSPGSTGCCLPASSCSVLGFRSSSNLAAAYGIAISGTMAITAVLAGIVARSHWERPPALAAAVFGAFLAVDLTFFRAHALKIAAGGWFPVVMAAAVFVLMSTWRRGLRAAVSRRAPS